MNQTVPTWKFWHPVPFWQVVVVLLAAQIAAGLMVGVASLFVTVPFPGGISGGIGGMLGWLVILLLARRARRG
jgi:hypothetical protein